MAEYAKTYDLCVVGAGMIGSAAARYASCFEGVSVCIIGPDEPTSRTLEDGREIFGAHYDEGRITRNSDPDHVWALFAQESIKRYRQLEETSGIHFYNEVGYLIAGEKDGTFMHETKSMVTDLDTVYYDPSELKEKFPYFNFKSNDEGVYEPNKSGYISPRNLIKAEMKVAEMNGCDVIRDVVSEITRSEKDSEIIMEIRTENGQMYKTRKVLIATGAFTAFRNLLGKDKCPDVNLMAANIAKVEINENDAKQLAGMPSVYYNGKGQEDWCKEFPGRIEDSFRFYMLPPIKYPDGKYYIKVGFSNFNRAELHTGEDVRKWYCSGGNPETNKHIAKFITDVIKGITMQSYHGDCCVICMTPTRRPYIDMVHPHLGVAIGGNGWAAKSCDEIGRMAATMVVKDVWDSPLSRECFKLQLTKEIGS